MEEEGDRNWIPILNRIRTRSSPPENQSSRGGDDTPATMIVGRVPLTVDVWRLDRGGEERSDEYAPSGIRKGFQKGRKIACWFRAYLAGQNSKNGFRSVPFKSDAHESDIMTFNMKDTLGAKHFTGCAYNNLKLAIPEQRVPGKTLKAQKSFSHELGPRGGIRPTFVKTNSFNNLRELLGSLHSKFDAAKELMNAQLTAFIFDVMDELEKNTEEQTMAENLLFLAQDCIKMTTSQFRGDCEGIVKYIDETRQLCQSGSLRQHMMQLLLILTPCTRLLQIQKDSGKITESLNRFKQCLDSIPAVEMRGSSKTKVPLDSMHDIPNLGPAYPESQLEFPTDEYTDSPCYRTSINLSDECLHESCSDTFSEMLQSVICRICEQNVPASHSRLHFYICACVDQCDLEDLSIDDRLLKVADMLGLFVEFYSQYFDEFFCGPRISSAQSDVSGVGYEFYPCKTHERHSKSMEGLFEDLHEMDTACLEDHYSKSSISLKRFLAMKLGTCISVSSSGSMTPGSSTSTPRSSYSDSASWFECDDTSMHEDISQMNEIANIARKAVTKDLANEEASTLLQTCLEEVEDVLKHNKVKALVVDTFGSRIKNLLMEKKSSNNTTECEKVGVEPVADASHALAPSPLSHKDRTNIDDFDIIKPISRGAFGKVFLAKKRTTGDLFAIKVLKKLDMIRKNDVERILAERDILIKVRNPFVVRFFYSFTSKDNLYLVMEYLNGGDLYSLLRKVGCLEEDVTRTYVAELVLALEYLHSLGIVHRDLKPDNILIAHDGHIKLTDFGLSKVGLMNNAIDISSSRGGRSTLLETGIQHGFPSLHQEAKEDHCSAVGTPDYLAPEILLGTAHGYNADWWSVGIILFELITGVPPFTDRLPEMIFDNILNKKIPWPNVPSEMSSEAKDLIDRLLIQDQNLRLGSNGASEIKAHPFFKDISWSNLALQKAAFIPQPNSADDTSYFVERYLQGPCQVQHNNSSSSCSSDASTSSLCDESEKVEKSNETTELDSSSPWDLSSLRFSFKNRSQLASMTYDALLQSERAPECSSPSHSSGPV